jgi:2-polyprenyl-3-methyl-5-hydroxy-6-metoxy-1,4-benzoquinol methylase
MGVEPPLTDEHAEKERLSPEEIEAGGLLAASHVHRYEVAAELCAGARVLDLCCGTGYGSRVLARTAASVHGVDVAEEAVAAARALLTGDEAERVTFERGDALEFLSALPAGRFDAIVCFEGLEHLPEPDPVVEELARLAGGGARLVVSVPNSRGFDERNEFHVTDFGHEEMEAVAKRLGATVVDQHLGEASLIRLPGEPGGALQGRLVQRDDDEPAWANHWLLVAGADPADLERATAVIGLAAAPFHNRYMRQLEAANAELLRANRRMGRAWLGIHDAAAAVVVRRLEEEVNRLDEELKHEQTEARKWRMIADGNAYAREEALREGQRARYRIVDAVFGQVSRIPLIGRAARGGYRQLTRGR